MIVKVSMIVNVMENDDIEMKLELIMIVISLILSFMIVVSMGSFVVRNEVNVNVKIMKVIRILMILDIFLIFILEKVMLFFIFV